MRLLLTVIAEPLTLTAPRSFSFGLMPIPVKPLIPDWRTVGMAGYAGPMTIDSFDGHNLKGDESTTFDLLPDGGDWDAVRRRMVPFAAHADDICAAFRARYGRDPNPEERTVPVLYWDMHWGGGDPSANREFLEAYGGDWWRRPEFVNYASWAFAQWVQQTHGALQGAYMDDMWGVPETGTASYRLPDGTLQPGFHFLLYRERIKRMRQILVDAGITPHLTAHATHTLFIPYLSFFDMICDGEDHYSVPASQDDFIDHWSLNRILFHHADKWGIVTTWLGPMGNSVRTEAYPAWTYRQTRAYTALLGTADISVSGIGPAVWSSCKLLNPGTVLLAGWHGDVLATGLPANVQATAWRHQGQTVLLLANLGNTRAEVDIRLELAKLGFPAQAAVQLRDVDAGLLTYFASDPTMLQLPDAPPEEENLGDNPVGGSTEDDLKKMPPAKRRAQDPDGKYSWEDGRLRCPIRRHDYRLFLLTAA